jgi:hypothetical protein
MSLLASSVEILTVAQLDKKLPAVASTRRFPTLQALKSAADIGEGKKEPKPN